MKKCEFFGYSEGGMLVRTYSDEGYYIIQVETQIPYPDAIDWGIEENGEYRPLYFTYVESLEKIKEEK